jgi:hypothetical protein
MNARTDVQLHETRQKERLEGIKADYQMDGSYFKPLRTAL